MEKQRVSSFMKDPTYTGILKYGKSGVVNLIELFGFQPMLSVEEFMTINKLSGNKELIKLARSFRKSENVKANLMREMVICNNCNEVMTPSIPTNRYGKKYFYYRCDNEDCERYGKSIRARMVMEYIYKYLDTKPFSSQASYSHYKKEMGRVSKERLLEAGRKLRSLQTQKLKLEEKVESIKDMLSSHESEDIKSLYRDDLKPTQEELRRIKEKIGEVKAYIEAGKVSILTYSEFVELMENMPKVLRKTKNMNDLDYVIRKMFLNFTVSPKEIVKSTLNSPFDSLEVQKVSLGARERI
jgi:hypothetical protein